MSWPEDLYRGTPIRRDETWPDYLRRREDERRWRAYDAQGTSAFGQDAKRLEAKPAGPVPEGDAP